jgi:hypothetical protein
MMMKGGMFMPRTYRKLDLSDYIITEQGDVINRHTGRKLKPQPNGKGYLRVGIGKKLMFVHRLVAEMYVPNPDNKPQVNHIDGDKTNNRADNLEWVSNLENRSHAVDSGLQVHGERCPWAKLTKEDVLAIRADEDATITELAKRYGVSRAAIRDVRQFKTWKTEKIC